MAARQHGVVSREQLFALCLSEAQIERELAAARLHRVFRGVYAVGHPAIGLLGRIQAAALAYGPEGVVSHGTAAALLGLTKKVPNSIHMITRGEQGRTISGVRWHRAPWPEERETTRVRGIRCTSVSRTLVDLAGSLGAQSLRRLVEEAAVQRSLDPAEIERILSRRRRRGATGLRTILSPWRSIPRDGPKLRSRFEARLLSELIAAGLPRPEANAALVLEGNRLEVDFLWKRQRLVVETDGEAAHGTRPAFRRDRWRDQLLSAASHRVMRITWSQLEEEPEKLLARIRRALEGNG